MEKNKPYTVQLKIFNPKLLSIINVDTNRGHTYSYIIKKIKKHPDITISPYNKRITIRGELFKCLFLNSIYMNMIIISEANLYYYIKQHVVSVADDSNKINHNTALNYPYKQIEHINEINL